LASHARLVIPGSRRLRLVRRWGATQVVVLRRRRPRVLAVARDQPLQPGQSRVQLGVPRPKLLDLAGLFLKPDRLATRQRDQISPRECLEVGHGTEPPHSPTYEPPTRTQLPLGVSQPDYSFRALTPHHVPQPTVTARSGPECLRYFAWSAEAPVCHSAS